MKKSHVFLGVLICCMFIAAIAALFLIEPPAGAREPLLLLVGSLSAGFVEGRQPAVVVIDGRGWG